VPITNDSQYLRPHSIVTNRLCSCFTAIRQQENLVDL
jgi:hypothetical protein